MEGVREHVDECIYHSLGRYPWSWQLNWRSSTGSFPGIIRSHFMPQTKSVLNKGSIKIIEHNTYKLQ